MSLLGVFDSGLGGLSVLRELRALMPQQAMLYLADGANCPYGEKEDGEIAALSRAAVAWLREQGAGVVVVACNTASAYSLHELRRWWQSGELAVVGLVPALKPAALASKSRVVAVLATKATLRGPLLSEAESRYAAPQGVQVLRLWHPELVPLIESGGAGKQHSKALLREVLAPALAAGADSLVLGCTHFPFLAADIKAVAPTLTLYDSGAGVARQTQAVLRERGMEQAAPHTPAASGGAIAQQATLQFFTTGDPQRTGEIAARLLGQAVGFQGLPALR